MALYRIRVSPDWLCGRWGYTDRLFNDLKGVRVSPLGEGNVWVVNYAGRPGRLGRLLSEVLHIQQVDYQRFGTIFEIDEIDEIYELDS